jgi:hypothetical protein
MILDRTLTFRNLVLGVTYRQIDRRIARAFSYQANGDSGQDIASIVCPARHLYDGH